MFTTTALMGNRVLVKGTDSTGTDGTTILDGSQWAQVTAYGKQSEAHAEFDAAVREFYAPLLAAAEKFEQGETVDDIGHIVLNEGTQSVAGEERLVVELHPHSIILRLIESGDTDRLLWVGDSLEITAPGAELPKPKRTRKTAS